MKSLSSNNPRMSRPLGRLMTLALFFLLISPLAYGQTRTENLNIDVGLDWLDISSKHTYAYKVSPDGERIHHGAFEIVGGENISANGIVFRANLNAKGSNADGYLNGPVSTSLTLYGSGRGMRMNSVTKMSGVFKSGIPNGLFTVSAMVDGTEQGSASGHASYKDGMLVGSYDCNGNTGSFDASGQLNGEWTYKNNNYEFIKGVMIRASLSDYETSPALKTLAANYANGKIKGKDLRNKGYYLEEGSWNLGRPFFDLLVEDMVGFWRKGGYYDFTQAVEPTSFLYLEKLETISAGDLENLLNQARRTGEYELGNDWKVEASYYSKNDKKYFLSEKQVEMLDEQVEAYKKDHAYTSLFKYYNENLLYEGRQPAKVISLEMAEKVLSRDYPADKAELWYKTARESVDSVSVIQASWFDPTEDKLFYRSIECMFESGYTVYGSYIKASAFDEFNALSEKIRNFDTNQFAVWKKEQEQEARENIVQLIKRHELLPKHTSNNAKSVKQCFTTNFGDITDCTVESVAPGSGDNHDIVTCIITSKGKYYPKKYRTKFDIYKSDAMNCKILVDNDKFKKNTTYLVGEEELQILQKLITDNKNKVDACGIPDIVQPFDEFINGSDCRISSNNYISTETRFLQIIEKEENCLNFIQNRQLFASQDAKIREECKLKALLKAYTSYMDKDEALPAELAWSPTKTGKDLEALVTMQKGILDALNTETGTIYDQRVKANKNVSIREMFTKTDDGKFKIDTMYTPKELKAMGK